uniref:Uncharacterized protein n=1 Tax=Romanomermis culicivorax TaxID=13658 RepID=A0A915I7E1_ROMCU
MITFAALSILLSKLAPSLCQNCVHFNQCSSTNHKNSCLFIKETTKCVSELARISGDFEDNFEEYPICAQNYVKTDVRSFVVRSPEGADFVKINLTFNEINFRVEALAFRQKCSTKNVDSTTKINMDSDPLCSNHSRPQWNRFHWPCRIFRFEHQGNFLQYPLETLFYPCFHAGRESNLMNIHILVYPQACQFVYAYTVPQMTYGSFEFRPFLVTDTNSKNGSLILRYQFLGHFEWLAKKELDILAEIDGKFASQRTVTENDDLSSFFVFTNLSNGRHVAAVQLLTEYCPDSMCPLTAIPFDIVNGVVAEREPKNIVDKKFVFSARIFVGLFILLFILCILASVAAVHYGTKLYKVRRKISRRGGIRRADVYE